MVFLFIFTLIWFVIAIFEYITKQNINAVIIVVLGILVFHSIYLEVIDSQVEEILEKLKEMDLSKIVIKMTTRYEAFWTRPKDLYTIKTKF